MKSDLTSLIISGRGHARDLRPKIYRMSKAALVRGAFAIQCTLSVPPVISAVSRCTHACSHSQSPIVKYGTVERSDLAKCRQDDLCCRRTIRRWNPEARGFRLMYGTPAADEKIFIHTPVSSKSSVPRWNRLGGGRNLLQERSAVASCMADHACVKFAPVSVRS